jgi:hypothetical protein
MTKNEVFAFVAGVIWGGTFTWRVSLYTWVAEQLAGKRKK